MAAGHETCTFCGAEIDATRDFQKVEGWDKMRKQGGTNAIALRTPLKVWACTGCIDKQKRGISVEQGSLL